MNARLSYLRLKTTLWTVALFLCLGSTATAQDAAFEDRVRDYILNNPEIILEALENLSLKQAKEAQRAKLAAYSELFDTPSVLGIGDADAPIRVLEYFDYKCVPCKAIHPRLMALVADTPQLRIEMKQLPILSPGSERAARFALATQQVAGQAAYAQVHSAIWDIRGPLTLHGFQQIADDLGLDFAAIEAEMHSDAVTAEVDGNRDLAIDLGIVGTPAFLTPDSLSIGQTDVQALGALWLGGAP